MDGSPRGSREAPRSHRAARPFEPQRPAHAGLAHPRARSPDERQSPALPFRPLDQLIVCAFAPGKLVLHDGGGRVGLW